MDKKSSLWEWWGTSRLSKEPVAAPVSLEVFQARLDGTWSNLG